MACFLVPAAEAVITTITTKIIEKKEKSSPKKSETVQVRLDNETVETAKRLPFSAKMKWLNHLLWGGSGLLAFEHLWHGEITPWFPFLTGAATPESTTEMLNEMSTVGVTMAVLVTLIWGGMMGISALIERKALIGSQDKINQEIEQETE